MLWISRRSLEKYIVTVGGIWSSLRIVSGLLNSRDWSWLILAFFGVVEERYGTRTTYTWTNTERIRDSPFQLQILNFCSTFPAPWRYYTKLMFLVWWKSVLSVWDSVPLNEKAARSCRMPLPCIGCNIRHFPTTKSSRWNKSILFADWGYGWWLMADWANYWGSVWSLSRELTNSLSLILTDRMIM